MENQSKKCPNFTSCRSIGRSNIMNSISTFCLVPMKTNCSGRFSGNGKPNWNFYLVTLTVIIIIERFQLQHHFCCSHKIIDVRFQSQKTILFQIDFYNLIHQFINILCIDLLYSSINFSCQFFDFFSLSSQLSRLLVLIFFSDGSKHIFL